MSTAVVVIVAIALYAGVFRAIGGFGAAAAALRRWGELSSKIRATTESHATTRTTSSPEPRRRA